MVEWVTTSLVKDASLAVWRWLRGRRGALKPEEIVAQRLKWKPIFDQRIAVARRDKLGRDVTVKDVRRLNTYPEIDENARGITPWFPAGLVGTNDRGLLLLLGWHSLASEALEYLALEGIQKQNAREVGNAALIGYVPFEQIVQVDWNGDDYYTRPSLYLHFDAKREGPYEKIGLRIRKEMQDIGAEWYSEICDIDLYQEACSKLGIKQDWLRSPLA
ncbi:MAG: hypothetical protein ABL897_02495 [Hyphomicrobium sp.]